jgi:hypothetical protein
MASDRLEELKKGLKKAGKPRSIITAVKNEDAEDKSHAHFYLSVDILDRMRLFQVNNRREFPRLSHVVEAALREFLDNRK